MHIFAHTHPQCFSPFGSDLRNHKFPWRLCSSVNVVCPCPVAATELWGRCSDQLSRAAPCPHPQTSALIRSVSREPFGLSADLGWTHGYRIWQKADPESVKWSCDVNWRGRLGFFQLLNSWLKRSLLSERIMASSSLTRFCLHVVSIHTESKSLLLVPAGECKANWVNWLFVRIRPAFTERSSAHAGARYRCSVSKDITWSRPSRTNGFCSSTLLLRLLPSTSCCSYKCARSMWEKRSSFCPTDLKKKHTNRDRWSPPTLMTLKY